MLNRTESPELIQSADIKIPEAKIIYINDNIPVIIVNEGTQEVMKVELVFSAGNISEESPMLASAASELLDEGTRKRSSAEIAEALDNYGAYFQTECGNDFASVSLYSLSRFLPETLPVLLEIINEPAYPEKEIVTFCVQGKQRLAVNQEKVDFLARKHFIHSLYGNQHPYGHFPTENDFDILNSEKLISFHKKNYLNGLVAVVIAGKFNDTQLNLAIEKINDSGFKKGKVERLNIASSPEDIQLHIPKEAAVQSAIRIGRRLFNRKHPDYFKFTILNTVLGGYFGSRLMSNIREDKGYTYGIGSGIIPQFFDGYFFISTEVGSDVCSDAIKEIHFELNRLVSEAIPISELNLVKSYLTGSFQRSIDGPFSLSDRYKTLVLNGLELDHYYAYLHTLKNVTSEELLETAHHYLEVIHMTQVIIGP